MRIIYLFHYHWFQILHIIYNIVVQAFYYQLTAIERSENAATCAHQPEYTHCYAYWKKSLYTKRAAIVPTVLVLDGFHCIP